MIAPRGERVGLPAARSHLVVGPSRSGGSLSASPAGTGAGARIALYAGVGEDELAELFDFVNLLPAWPGASAEGSKWDGFPNPHSWEVGQRVSLLLADLHERPRHSVVLLGSWVVSAMSAWAGCAALDPAQLGWSDGPGGCTLYASPHPSGTNMWWNDPTNRILGERFWQGKAGEAARALPRSPRKVRATVRSQWLLDLAAKLEHQGWPDECVDWPWLEPVGQRPAAYYRGKAVPASHAVLEATGRPRPSDRHQALHSCDRGEHCVNAAHLRWGTELENRLDQSARSRGDIGKVGLETAREVRRELEELSARTGVPMDAIQRIAGGRSWSEESWTEETD